MNKPIKPREPEPDTAKPEPTAAEPVGVTEQLGQLVRDHRKQQPTWDGNLISKSNRDWLIACGWAVRTEG